VAQFPPEPQQQVEQMFIHFGLLIVAQIGTEV